MDSLIEMYAIDGLFEIFPKIGNYPSIINRNRKWLDIIYLGDFLLKEYEMNIKFISNSTNEIVYDRNVCLEHIMPKAEFVDLIDDFPVDAFEGMDQVEFLKRFRLELTSSPT